MTDTEQRWDDVVNEDNQLERTNFLVLVLDRSSSMASLRAEAIGAFNEQLKTVREATEDTNVNVLVSLVTFAGRVDTPELWCTPLHQVLDLTEDNYVPQGMTAMYDAVGYTIQELQEHPLINDENSSVLVVVISDGHENSSREFDSPKLAAIIKEMQDSGRWTFAYEGANQDLAVVSMNIGINRGSTLSFVADAVGMAISGQIRQEASRQYYSNVSKGLATQSTSFYDDAKKTPTDPEPSTTGDSKGNIITSTTGGIN